MAPNSSLGDTNYINEGNEEAVQCVKPTSLIGIGVAFLFVLSGKINLSWKRNCVRGFRSSAKFIIIFNPSFLMLIWTIQISWYANQCYQKMEKHPKLSVHGVGRIRSHGCSTFLSCYWTQIKNFSRLRKFR